MQVARLCACLLEYGPRLLVPTPFLLMNVRSSGVNSGHEKISRGQKSYLLSQTKKSSSYYSRMQIWRWGIQYKLQGPGTAALLSRLGLFIRNVLPCSGEVSMHDFSLNHCFAPPSWMKPQLFHLKTEDNTPEEYKISWKQWYEPRVKYTERRSRNAPLRRLLRRLPRLKQRLYGKENTMAS